MGDLENLSFLGKFDREREKYRSPWQSGADDEKGDILHRGYGECSGMVYVSSGQLRTYIVSEDGRGQLLTQLGTSANVPAISLRTDG